jgi:KUP system potassium uptake protein
VLLAIAVLAVTVGFRSSDALASAYGIAVTTTISITTIVYLAYTWTHARRVTPRLVIAAALLAVVLLFLAANLPKAPTGGWLPLSIGALAFVVMATWWVGQRRIQAGLRRGEVSLDRLEDLLTPSEGSLYRVPGDAVFITRDSRIVPLALRAMVSQNHVLQDRAILLSWSTADVPSTLGARHRIVVEKRSEGIVVVIATIGFRERPRMTQLLAEAQQIDEDAFAKFSEPDATFFISTPIPRYNSHSRMFRWAQTLFLALTRLAPDQLDLIELPRDRTILLGREVQL